EEVRQVLGLGADGELAGQDLAPLAERAVAAYVERGYDDARVTLQLRDTDDPTRKVLIVRVDEGEPVRVSRYVYDGPPPPRDVDLPGALGVSEGDVLDRARLAEGLREARRALRREGFLEARLGEPTIERDGGEASLALPIRWGPR